MTRALPAGERRRLLGPGHPVRGPSQAGAGVVGPRAAGHHGVRGESG